ncbi:MAG: exodeoxyribonuclease V subunit gamma [Planctomycetia bacterium]|nr:exodeoxyribonuclease V subunit gamma [Planctomycetia bacterium]
MSTPLVDSFAKTLLMRTTEAEGMFRGTTVLAGPARCGKTQCLLDSYRQVLADEPFGAALWLGPTHRAVAVVRDQLLAGSFSGCFNPNCLTFDHFASRVLEASPLKSRSIGALIERQILRRLIGLALDERKLDYFAPIARTPGFLDLLERFVQEMKRLEIWPAELAASCGRAEKDRELCSLYENYQRILTEHDLYDAQGRFWSARALLRDGQQKPFERLQHVVVDGFTDFTRTEHEILEILAARVTSLTISLPLEVNSPRQDLFAKAAKTLAEFEGRHPQLVVREMPSRPLACAAIGHVERLLFSNPREAVPASDAAGIEIVTAAGLVNEIELLARRIKQLLTRGDSDCPDARVRPGDILVVFRSLGETAEVVREVFREFGIPVAVGTGLSLERAPILAALSAWLRLDLEDWPFRQVLGLLVHNFFRPDWPEWQQGQAAADAEKLVRWLQIPAGREALEAQLERLAAAGSAAGDGSRRERQKLLGGAAKLAWPLVRRMGQALDRLPERATLTEWAAAIGSLAEAVGLLRSADLSRVAAGGLSVDRLAWEQLIAALHASEHLSNWIGEVPAVLSRREFFEHFQEVLRCELMPQASDETGRIRVLAAESARNLSAPYLFLAGLSEKSFPAARGDDCILNEADVARLIAGGLPLLPQSERSRHEMLLFYELVTRATRRLVLSYPALDQSAQPLSPSPYLSEVERVCGKDRIAGGEPPDLSVVPRSDDVLCPRDFRTRAVANAVDGDTGLLAELIHHPATKRAAVNVLWSLRASCARQRGESFGPYEGMLLGDAARQAVRGRYGPERCWSPSQLEQYARCPYQFFLDRVLHLEPAEDPVLEVDYLARGRMLHWLLSRLHRKLNERCGGPSSPGDQAEQALVDEIGVVVAELLARMRSDRPLDNGLREIDARQLVAWLASYRQQHAKYDAAWRELQRPLKPTHFEVSFGPGHHSDELEQADAEDAEDALSTREPFELICGQETIRFTGRIDRIDIGELSGQCVFSIVDYKTSASFRTNAKSIQDGYAFQLPLYAMAAEELLSKKQAIPFCAGYWNVAESGFKEAISFHAVADGQLQISPEWESLRAQLRQRIGSLIEGIREGQFPMHSADEKCTSRCAYSTVCRVNQVRALGKSWQAPREGLA